MEKELIKLTLIDGRKVTIGQYVKAKTKALREFGYTSLTEAEVLKQLVRIKKGKPLTVIGEFMKPDLKEEE